MAERLHSSNSPEKFSQIQSDEARKDWQEPDQTPRHFFTRRHLQKHQKQNVRKGNANCAALREHYNGPEEGILWSLAWRLTTQLTRIDPTLPIPGVVLYCSQNESESCPGSRSREEPLECEKIKHRNHLWLVAEQDS